MLWVHSSASEEEISRLGWGWVFDKTNQVQSFTFSSLKELIAYLEEKVLPDREYFWEKKYPEWHERVLKYLKK